MASEVLHAPRERLTAKTLALHHAITSVIEELEAVDWYRQRADDCDDQELKEILLHNMREEIEHATMTLEWLRRNDGNFAEQFGTYLFSEGPILEVEERAEAGEGHSDPSRKGKGGEGGPAHAGDWQAESLKPGQTSGEDKGQRQGGDVHQGAGWTPLE